MDRTDFERLNAAGAFAEPAQANTVHTAEPDELSISTSDCTTPESAFNSFGFYSVQDLTEEERRPPEFIVEGLIPCGMSFISGAPKIRKSFLALQIAAAVATGKPVLGFNTRKCDVAYLDLEGSKSRSAARAERMSIQVPRNLYITHAITDRLANGLVEKLRRLHHETPSIRLVIIDTFSRARGQVRTGGANAYDSDVALLEPLQRMAIDENIAVLFVHHDKKGASLVSDSFERLSGTMGISGSADCVINLVAEGSRFDGRASLEYNPRDARGGEMKLQFDETCGEWMRVADLPPVDIRGNPVCKWVIDNAPVKRADAQSFTYDAIVRGAYGGFYQDDPGNKVREQIKPNLDALYSEYGLAIQLGIKSHGARGIRVLNLQE